MASQVAEYGGKAKLADTTTHFQMPKIISFRPTFAYFLPSTLRKDDTDWGQLIPFHKLSQWLTYSLLEPLRVCRTIYLSRSCHYQNKISFPLMSLPSGCWY